MPRYFFNFQDRRTIPDEVGTVLPGPDEAHAQAVTAAAEAVRDLGSEFWKAAEWQMHVTNEQGATVCMLSIKGVRARPRGRFGGNSSAIVLP